MRLLAPGGGLDSAPIVTTKFNGPRIEREIPLNYITFHYQFFSVFSSFVYSFGVLSYRDALLYIGEK